VPTQKDVPLKTAGCGLRHGVQSGPAGRKKVIPPPRLARTRSRTPARVPWKKEGPPALSIVSPISPQRGSAWWAGFRVTPQTPSSCALISSCRYWSDQSERHAESPPLWGGFLVGTDGLAAAVLLNISKRALHLLRECPLRTPMNTPSIGVPLNFSTSGSRRAKAPR